MGVKLLSLLCFSSEILLRCFDFSWIFISRPNWFISRLSNRPWSSSRLFPRSRFYLVFLCRFHTNHPEVLFFFLRGDLIIFWLIIKKKIKLDSLVLLAVFWRLYLSSRHTSTDLIGCWYSWDELKHMQSLCEFPEQPCSKSRTRCVGNPQIASWLN